MNRTVELTGVPLAEKADFCTFRRVALLGASERPDRHGSPETISLASTSKMVERRQTLPTADPILKNSEFGLMTDLEMWLPSRLINRLFFNDFCKL